MEDERWSALEMAPISPDDEELVAFFFRAFSRFEYAMKQTKYRKTKVSGQDVLVEPDWEQLGNELDENLDERFTEAAASEDVMYLKDLPPQIQVIDEAGILGFAPRDGSLLRHVRTVRNNLFHGGKQPWDPYRDRRLVRASLDILAASLDLDQNLREAYDR